MAGEVQRAYSSKLEEQASAKGDISYSFWAANSNVTSTVPEPKKLSDEEALEQAQKELQAANTGASAWNAGGLTFEERNVADWAKDTLKELLIEAPHSPTITADGCTLKLTELVSCSGDAHQWIVRGQRRAGFEFEIKVKWTLEGAGKSASGTAKVPEASSDDLDDMEVEIEVQSAEPSEYSSGAKAAVGKDLRSLLLGRLNDLIEKIKTK